MQNNNQHTSEAQTTIDISLPEPDRDFSTILKSFGLDFKSSGYYWQVGEIRQVQAWILHLSVIKFKVTQLLRVVIPELMTSNTAFKIARDFDTTGFLLDGTLGYVNLAKIVCIYPETNKDAVQLAKRLIALTSSFEGPAIVTDSHLSGIVYTRYGSFNPITKTDVDGQIMKYIYNENGQLTPDPYSIPFSLPRHRTWPFGEIAQPARSKRRLLHSTYYPISHLKIDFKGDVTKALFFKTFWQIKPCIIKQGRRWMTIDHEGRDIRDKLKWQYDVHKDLEGIVPIPKIISHFYEDGDAYLVMEFIHGISLHHWVQLTFKSRCWQDLSISSKFRLLDILSEIIRLTSKLHEYGYVHRDITLGNFLIDNKKKIYFIDMELAWSLRSGLPFPPFQLGTFGFMSPEQQLAIRPTIQEDIYGLGALMMAFFTNLYPGQFNMRMPLMLKENLSLFIKEETIRKLICDCIDASPVRRPSVKEMLSTLANYRIQLQQEDSTAENTSTCTNESIAENLRQTIQAGINGLSVERLLSPKLRWVSIKQKKQQFTGNDRVELALYEGWHTGMAGPLWLIALAKRAGFKTEACTEAYRASRDYIFARHETNSSSMDASLFAGTAGIAIMLAESLESQIISPDNKTISWLTGCFSSSLSGITLSTGLAGQGIAILRCANWIESSKVENLLNSILKNILVSQNRDGSWALPENSGSKRDIILGLNNGIAGVIWFLLAFCKQYPDGKPRIAVASALNWLAEKSRRKNDSCEWPVTTKSKTTDKLTLSQGNPGIALCFIQAYELFKEPIYKKIAEEVLLNLPSRIVVQDLTLSTGIAGLGEVYLEAYRAFRDILWLQRATWIVNLLVRTFQYIDTGKGYWLPTVNDCVTADLSSGVSGILHFLIRYHSEAKLTHLQGLHNKV